MIMDNKLKSNVSFNPYPLIDYSKHKPRKRTKAKSIKSSRKQSGKFQCGFCSKTYNNKSEYDEHTQNDHDLDEENAFGCRFCKNFFKTSQGLERHIKIHTGNNKVACPQCNSMLASAGSLSNHIKKIHPKDK
eukprot:145925_1